MTRDEAHTAVCKAWVFDPKSGEARISTHGLLDTLVALGLLKLEEPKSAAAAQLSSLAAALDCGPNWLSRKADEFGLKIVEK